MVSPPNVIYEGNSSLSLNKDQNDTNLPSPIGSSPSPYPPIPTQKMNLPEMFHPPGNNLDKEIITLAYSTWTSCPNGVPELCSFYASE